MCMFVYVARFKRVLVFNNPSCFPPPEKDETGQVLSLYKKNRLCAGSDRLSGRNNDLVSKKHSTSPPAP